MTFIPSGFGMKVFWVMAGDQKTCNQSLSKRRSFLICKVTLIFLFMHKLEFTDKWNLFL